MKKIVLLLLLFSLFACKEEPKEVYNVIGFSNIKTNECSWATGIFIKTTSYLDLSLESEMIPRDQKRHKIKYNNNNHIITIRNKYESIFILDTLFNKKLILDNTLTNHMPPYILPDALLKSPFGVENKDTLFVYLKRVKS